MKVCEGYEEGGCVDVMKNRKWNKGVVVGVCYCNVWLACEGGLREWSGGVSWSGVMGWRHGVEAWGGGVGWGRRVRV